MNPQEDRDRNDIDELLSAFIDGELSGREQTEVHRLVAHDVNIAQRLGRLEACRKLLGSLPPAEAPAGLTERIMAGVWKERTAITAGSGGGRIGAMHLYARRLTAAAAAIALIGILAGVVYEIVSPVHSEKPLAKDTQPRLVAPLAETQPKTDTAAAPAESDVFEGRLILTAQDVTAAEAFIKKTLETNGVARQEVMKDAAVGGTYFVSCSRERLDLLLNDLETIWRRFDSATLVVAGRSGGEAVVVDGVSVSQIEQIVRENAADVRYRLAKEFATVNAVQEMMPAREFLAAKGFSGEEMLTIPRPVLTGGEETGRQPEERGGPVQLTIIIAQPK